MTAVSSTDGSAETPTQASATKETSEDNGMVDPEALPTSQDSQPTASTVRNISIKNAEG
jgi:hypothetical protein